MNYVSLEECLIELKRVYSIAGKVTYRTLKEYGNVSSSSIVKKFGCMETACKLAGIPTTDLRRKNISKKMLIEDILKVHSQFGYISKPLYEKNGTINQKVVRRIFGSFANMYAELGLNRHPSGYVASDEELIQELINLNNIYGVVNVKIIKDFGRFSTTTYMERFGSINNSYKKAGLPTRTCGGDSSTAHWVIEKFARNLNEEPIYEQRFDWLVNYKTNRKLPIDAYFPKSNIAIEYNGPQHYRTNNLYMPTQQKLDYRIWLDSIKYKLIREHGIHLIVIHYEDKINEEYINQKISIRE